MTPLDDETLARIWKAQEELERRAAGTKPPPPGMKPIGAYAEDFPELLEEQLAHPELEPWGELEEEE